MGFTSDTRGGCKALAATASADARRNPVEQVARLRHPTPVRRWFFIVSLLLALLWAPATSHCLLEHAGWIHHSECCAEHDAASALGHDAADGVCHVTANEAELAKRPDAAIDLLTCSAVALLVAVWEAPVADATAWHSGAAKSLSPRWQFVLRTALPPRAPSC
jgi:hypothetical protein